MTEKTDEKRKAPISYRPPVKLQAEFDRRVRLSGLSVNAFITQATLGADPPRQSRRPSTEETELVRLLAVLPRVHARLAEIEEAEPSLAPLMDEIRRALDPVALRSAAFLALGRKP